MSKKQEQKKETFIKNLIKITGKSRESALNLWNKTMENQEKREDKIFIEKHLKNIKSLQKKYNK